MRFRTVITALAAVLAILPFKAGAQGSGKDNVFGGIVRLDRTIHDFGDIMVSDGPVTAIFKAENVSSAPMVIYNVVSSCGCTDVEWNRGRPAPSRRHTRMTREAILSTRLSPSISRE